MDTTWQDAIDAVKPFVVRISTPQASGTGFLLYRSKVSAICGIATAAHLIDHAHYWELPIRIEHYLSGESQLLRNEQRAILLDEERDTAVIILGNNGFPLPEEGPDLWAEGQFLKLGNEVGWLGFPAVAPPKILCFFSGRVSCYLDTEHAYLVDGVAINGVSGGPTFSPVNGFYIVGVVSAYAPNRSTGEILPGVSVVRDVSHLQELVKHFQSVDEAKQKESQLATPPPPSPESGADQEIR